MAPIAELMDEHTALVNQGHQVHQDLDAGDQTAAKARLAFLVADLDRHVRREELEIFLVSVVTLGASGWAMVDRAHAESQSFLLDASGDPQQSHEEESTCRRSH